MYISIAFLWFFFIIFLNVSPSNIRHLFEYSLVSYYYHFISIFQCCCLLLLLSNTFLLFINLTQFLFNFFFYTYENIYLTIITIIYNKRIGFKDKQRKKRVRVYYYIERPTPGFDQLNIALSIQHSVEREYCNKLMVKEREGETVYIYIFGPDVDQHWPEGTESRGLWITLPPSARSL